MGVWCKWNGEYPEECKCDDRMGYFSLYNGTVVRETEYKKYGYYKLIIIEPTIESHQIKDTEVFEFVDNQILKTWTVRDMTAEEIDQKDAIPMNITDYYIWKALLKTGLITQVQAVANLPAEMITAYKARAKLLGD